MSKLTLIWLMSCLMFFDLIMTGSSVYRWGIKAELNPIVRGLYVNHSLILAGLYLLVYSILVYYLIIYYDNEWYKLKANRYTLYLTYGIFIVIDSIHILNYILPKIVD